MNWRAFSRNGSASDKVAENIGVVESWSDGALGKDLGPSFG